MTKFTHLEDNPLLRDYSEAPFGAFEVRHAVPAITTILSENRLALAQLLSAGRPRSWEETIIPLERLRHRLDRAFSVIRHLNAVMSNMEGLEDAYGQCLAMITEYQAEVGQNRELFETVLEISRQESLGAVERKMLGDWIVLFRLSGVDLDEQQGAEFKRIKLRLSELETQFERNLLDATDSWTLHVTDEVKLSGIPELARVAAKQEAQTRGMAGWLFTLQYPSVMAVLTYADDEELARLVYEAYNTRASDQGPCAGSHDNTEVMVEILNLRDDLAKLLGFDNFAELSLVTKMAPSSDAAVKFLDSLGQRAKPIAVQELDELTEFAREYTGAVDDYLVPAWRMQYFSEKLRVARFDISQEQLREFFPVERVLNGLFSIASRLFGICISPVEDAPAWHPDVRFFEIRDRGDNLRGRFYLDLFARANKRGGAWMDECVTRMQTESETYIPIAFLTCNFTPPIEGKPALLTHDEVVTLFHEFGHGLHHMLSLVDYPSVSGINGVPWDGVELPSQFMENFCWQKEALRLMSGHYGVPGAPGLSDELITRLVKAHNFQSGMRTVRQLEFGIFDMFVHSGLYKRWTPEKIRTAVGLARGCVAVILPPEFNRYENGFAHIYAGGYAAGYYSYKWAELLSCDAFGRFLEEDILNPGTGAAFRETILEQGGSRDFMELFVEFRGREPSIEAMLKSGGLS